VIHDSPIFRPAGDTMLEIELGNEMSFELNFLAHSFASAIKQVRIDGFVELVTELASLQVVYDPDLISYSDMVRELERVRDSMGEMGDAELNSRIYYVPALYFDPWTAACVDDYREKIAEKDISDPELIIQLNNLDDRDHLKRVHSSTEYWVAALGFWPGLCSLMPLDPRSRLAAPKYNPPRMWTPKGTIGLGGAVTCIYPDQTPGGYQIFARTPMPTWDRDQTLPAFRDRLALIKAGDRVKFLPIERDEYDYIEARVAEGSYTHPYVDYQRFSIGSYKIWLDTIKAETGGA